MDPSCLGAPTAQSLSIQAMKGAGTAHTSPLVSSRPRVASTPAPRAARTVSDLAQRLKARRALVAEDFRSATGLRDARQRRDGARGQRPEVARKITKATTHPAKRTSNASRLVRLGTNLHASGSALARHEPAVRDHCLSIAAGRSGDRRELSLGLPKHGTSERHAPSSPGEAEALASPCPGPGRRPVRSCARHSIERSLTRKAPPSPPRISRFAGLGALHLPTVAPKR